MARWLVCPSCKGVFAFVREGVTISRFMPIQSDHYEDWDGEFFERHSDIRCIDCGRLPAEMDHMPFLLANLRAGHLPFPRAMLTMIGHRGEGEAQAILAEAISIGSYCTLDERRKLIVPAFRGTVAE